MASRGSEMAVSPEVAAAIYGERAAVIEFLKARARSLAESGLTTAAAALSGAAARIEKGDHHK
jgi:hypothetical protein